VTGAKPLQVQSKLYELIADGHIEIVKVGAMTLVPLDSLQALIGRGSRGDER
jgi:hypothetical protein